MNDRPPPPALPSDTVTLLADLRERRSVEFKRGMPWSEVRHKVVKSILGMSNVPDGGFIVIGVEEIEAGQFELAGLTPDDFDSFREDTINDVVNQFADPPLSVTLHKGEAGSLLFVVIQIPPFSDLPTICKRDGGSNNELRQGAIYTRSIHKPETTEVRSQNEMREIIDRATDLALARLRQRFPELFEPRERTEELLRRELGEFE